ncbi:MAG: hypothetical protein IH937_11940 [Acidobacteria bacterium]|nr:hypothetical protein [Acidobacteriota bacterium]
MTKKGKGRATPDVEPKNNGTVSDQPEGKTHGDDKSQADMLVELATKVGAQFFHDQFHRSHVRLLIEGHREIWPCRSKDFRNWLASPDYA